LTLSLAQRRALSWCAIGAVLLALLSLLAPVLTPFLIGAIGAYALHPLVERLAVRRVPRLLAVLVVEVAVLAALLAVVLLIVPILSQEIPLLQAQIPLLAEKLNRTVAPWLAQQGIELELDVASIKAFVLKYLSTNAEEWGAALLSSLRIGGSVALTVVGNALLVPVVLFYLLSDWPRIVERTRALVPPRLRPAVEGFLADCDGLLGQYLRGQIAVMLVLATYYAAGLTLFGFDLALPVGVFTGLAVFIPYLGFALGLMLALMAAILQFASVQGLVAVAVVYGLGQLLESFWLTPRLVGERIGLNPLAVIFALMAFGHLFGFVGVLVALPLSAVALVAWQRLKSLYLRSDLFSQ
jgi:predicted PurR-regulated permease PerM